MKIRRVGIKGFRGYSKPIQVEVDDLLVLVGKNDIGKSTILEALDIFFNDGKGSVRIDKEDINKSNLAAGDDSIEIFVEFIRLPESIVIDSTNETTLAGEYLLTEARTLKVIKRYPGAGKEKVYIAAHHPTAAGCADLLLKKNAELKTLLDTQGLECKDRTRNSELRKAIWMGQAELQLQDIEIDVAKIDAKSIWDQLKAYMPLYSLFQADRKNSDADNEVQDPMRLAVREILAEATINAELARVADTVKKRLEEVAAETLMKLKELNPSIASSLNPTIPDAASLKWADVFKNVAITGDKQIPVNKRGSGVRRLILISFFRAEAERRRREANLPSVVYAIEEPETSQHPEHQRALIAALIALSKAPGTQILLTTHSPEIVKRLKFENLLLVAGQRSEEIRRVQESELPYPSLNEVNFAAFDEASYEYHNELYGFIEAERVLETFKAGQPTVAYNRLHKDGSLTLQQLVLTEYVRHQIHHPENTHNRRFTDQELRQSIAAMRDFIQEHRKVVSGGSVNR